MKPEAIETGSQIGALLILSIGEKDDHNEVLADFLCDCGKKWKFRISTAIRNRNRGCTCKRREWILSHAKNLATQNRKPLGEASFNGLYGKYQRVAKLRGYSFDLSREEFRQITSGNCAYCGSPPGQIFYRKNHNGTYTYNGVDRLNSDVGYVMSNCVSCCKTCNRMKMEMAVEFFIAHLRKIVKHLA